VRLFVWRSSNSKTDRCGVVVGDGEFEFPIVGESHYQRALESIVGGKTERGHEHLCAALLLPEPANPYDKNAVCVKIRQLTVGHLARDVAQDFALALRQRGFSRAAAEAMIVGGWRRRGGDEGCQIKCHNTFCF
jgi:hypothetical protein